MPAIFPCRSRSAGFRFVPYVALQRALLGIMKSVPPSGGTRVAVSRLSTCATVVLGLSLLDLAHFPSQKGSCPGSSFSQKNIIHSALIAAALALVSSSQVKSSILRLSFLAAVAVVGVDAVQRLEHDDGVAADHAHAQADLLIVGLALGGFVEDDVEEDVVAAQRAHDFARAVELHFDALVEVLV